VESTQVVLKITQELSGFVRLSRWFPPALNPSARLLHENGYLYIITFRVKCSRGEMYIGHGRLCVSVCLCVCLSLAAFPHYCTDPDVSWGMVGVWPLVVHYWADLQAVHEFRCYDNRAPNAKCQRVLVLAVCLVEICCCGICHVAQDVTAYSVTQL